MNVRIYRISEYEEDPDMGADIISILFFITAIVLAFIRKINIGIVALALAVPCTMLIGLPGKEIIAGVNGNLSITLVGITLLFSIVNDTGALGLLAHKIVAVAGRRLWLIPILLFVAGGIITGAGPGGIPVLAIMIPMGIAVGIRVGYNPVMLSLIGICGMTGGRFSPITPETAIIFSALENTGISSASAVPAIIVNVTLFNAVVAVLLFIAFKGYKVKAPEQMERDEEGTKSFTTKQWISFGGIIAMLALIIFAKVNVGLAALIVSAVLLLCHIADDGKCIKSVPWGTILMVLGVGALLHIVAKTGGIALLTQILAGMMSPSTASTFMALSAGLLSFVSSALGVVYPTMMPMSVGIAQQIGGINPVALMSAVAAGGSCSGISPMSTGGAMIIAIMAVELKDRFTKEQQNKVFVQLLVIAGANLLVLMACTFLFFDVIANILCPL
jgi:di/tricarboxylate transporter